MALLTAYLLSLTLSAQGTGTATRTGPATPTPRTPAASKPTSALRAMDDAQLVKALQDYGMSDLLLAWADAAIQSADAARLNVVVAALSAEAARSTDPRTREPLFDRVLMLQDKVIEAGKSASNYKDRVQHFRNVLARAVTEGVTRSEFYGQRIQYLLDSPSDRQKVLDFTGKGLPALRKLEADIGKARQSWERDEESQITGAYFQLDDVLKELQYRRAFMELYRGLALGRDAAAQKEKTDLLEQAVSDVKEFANATDDEMGVRFMSLMVTGAAQRELGKQDAARATLKKMLTAECPDDLMLKSLFETAHTYIDDGKADEADKAIAAFKTEAMKMVEAKKFMKVAVDMQSSLLYSHLYESQALRVKTTDVPGYKKLMRQSVQVMLDFLKANPSYSGDFMALLAPKFDDDAENEVPPAILPALAEWNLAKGTPEGLKKAERLYQIVAKDKDPANQDAQIMALGNLGVLAVRDKRWLDAAMSYRELATRFPKHPKAKTAAQEAVRCMQSLINAPGAKPTDADYAEFVLDLEVLLNGWGAQVKELRDYYYLLGRQYERINHDDQAIAQYEKIDAASLTYLPAQYGAMRLKANTLMEMKNDPATDQARRQKAQSLISDINNFDKAVAAFQTPDANRRKEVREMAAAMDLMKARLYMDVLDQRDPARMAAEQVQRDWPDVPGVADQALVIQVSAHLKSGELEQALKLVDQIKTNSDKAIADVVSQLRSRIERLDPQKNAKELETYVGVYTKFSKMLYDKAVADGARGEQLYRVSQALAGAYEYSPDKDKITEALTIYQKLAEQNKDDAINIRGKARCYRKIPAVGEAMGAYDDLVKHLPRRSPDWWKARLERLQFCVEAFGAKTEDLQKIMLEITRLAEDDIDLGGAMLRPKFVELKTQVEAKIGKKP